MGRLPEVIECDAVVVNAGAERLPNDAFDEIVQQLPNKLQLSRRQLSFSMNLIDFGFMMRTQMTKKNWRQKMHWNNCRGDLIG